MLAVVLLYYMNNELSLVTEHSIHHVLNCNLLRFYIFMFLSPYRMEMASFCIITVHNKHLLLLFLQCSFALSVQHTLCWIQTKLVYVQLLVKSVGLH